MEEITDILQWALRDPVLWAEIKDWELETSQRAAEAEKLGIEDPFGAEADAVFGPPQHPAPNSRIVALVKRRFGDQKFDYFLLTIALKRLAREELGLPTDLSLKDDDVEDPK
jgi:hypothetical protein